jgi:putative flippase GtrA
MQATISQLFRYCIIGISSNALLYAFYLLITSQGIEPLTAVGLSYALGATAAFVLNRQWTFPHRGNFAGTLVRYGLTHLLGYLLNLVIIHIFFELMGYPHQVVQAAAILIVAAFLFLAFKYFVFRIKNDSKGKY